MKLSERMAGIGPNILLELEDIKRARLTRGEPVINLSAGTPDLPPDNHVMTALSDACLDPENYKYAIADSPALTDAAVQWYARRFGVRLERDQVMSVYGSQEGIAHIGFPLCNPGDTVLVPDPGYPIFSFGPFLAGATLVRMPLREANGYLIDFDAIDPVVAHAAKFMIVSYPSNPCTARADAAFYERLVRFAKKYDIFVIHDNAYSELTLTGAPGMSFLQVEGAVDIGMEFNSLSKSYNLTGARISFALGNKDVIGAFRRFRSQIDYGPFPAVQKAAIAALSGPQDILERNRREYRARRDALSNGLREAGWPVPDCDSTMFTWYPLPPGYSDDVAFTFELLEKTGVICVPGSSFGEMGTGYVRFALVQPTSVLTQAVRFIAESGMLNAR
ncbi:MAG: aminotransferase class I/II-fold pyridoxal phosphate-dependent enzyme [Oscillospiraceae bacterium]|nr:aminotransferase class I/II-fold pyridoxal phosphate-dependent enzyme [Oscillospiraceae bacterium]